MLPKEDQDTLEKVREIYALQYQSENDSPDVVLRRVFAISLFRSYFSKRTDILHRKSLGDEGETRSPLADEPLSTSTASGSELPTGRFGRLLSGLWNRSGNRSSGSGEVRASSVPLANVFGHIVHVPGDGKRDEGNSFYLGTTSW